MTETTDTAPLRAELERVAAPENVRTVFDLIERQKPELAKALPESVGVERFTRTVLTEIRRTPKLLECSPESLLGAMMLSAQLGLEPGPLGQVYLVPFKRQVEFIVGYKGYITLAYRSGQVKDIQARLVHEGDYFKPRFGSSPKIDHDPEGPPDQREIIASYAVARLRTGGTVFEISYLADWEAAKKRSAAGSKNTGPWVTDRTAMILKTPVRRVARWVPMSPLFAQAIERDEAPAPEVVELADSESPL